MKTKDIIAVTAALTAALLLSCANQAAPGGGPLDKEPPRASESSPESGQTGVDPRAPVTVRFSEWINTATATATATGAVSVYPPPPGGFSVKAARDRISIVPKEPLTDSTTYHVVIGTSLQDLRGNAVAHPINVIFSTGAELDGGVLGGAVVPLAPLVTVPRVALYRDGDDWADERYFAAPDYVAHLDSTGAFSFSHLREGRYRAVAFTDQYRTGRLRPGDPVFTSLEQSVNVTRDTQTVRLYPSDSDTATSPRVIEKPADDTIPPKLKGRLPTGLTSLMPELLLLWTKPVRVNLSMVTAVEAADTAGIDKAADTANIDNAGADTGDIKVTDINTAAITAAEVDSVIFFFATVGGYSDTTRLIPSKRMKPGTTYRLNIPAQAVRDVNGNAAADSVSVTVKTIPADSISYRLQGGAGCLEPSGSRKWVYRPTGRDEIFTVADRDGTFSFDTIPASRGTLMWFIDDNNDNRLTPGKLLPWRPPERFFIVPDTVQAKARWEVDGLQVRGCE